MLATTQRFCWLFCATLSVLPSMASAESKNSRPEWPMSGQNVQNTASNDEERKISTSNVATLAPKWVATTGGDVSARAAVVRGAVYFPDFGGNLWALDADTGAVIWKVELSALFGLKSGTVVSRTSPAFQRDTVYIGTQAGPDYTPQGGIGAQSGANLLAFNAKTGDLRWMLQLDPNQKVAGLTASPAILEDVIHIGVSGVAQEVGVADDAVPCCSFIGSEVAVNVRTQKILWKTPMAPSGYTGTSVWGSNAVVDAQRKSVFIGTGNNYSTPTAPAYVQCISAGGKPEDCLSRDDHVDSIVALDTRNGRIKWSQRLTNGDDWNVACNKSPVGKNCPMPRGWISTSAPHRTRFPSGCQRRMDTRMNTTMNAGRSSAPGRRAACIRPLIRTRVISCGARRSGPAGHLAVSSGARPPTASGSTSPSQITLTYPTKTQTARSSARRARGALSIRSTEISCGRHPILTARTTLAR